MRAIRAYFDGTNVVLPPAMHGLEPCDLILIFEDADGRRDWTLAQEESLQKAWDNDEDAAYDAL